MPKLNDHGLGGGGKSLGVPVYPFEPFDVYVEDENGAHTSWYNIDAITTPPSTLLSNAHAQIGDDLYFIGTFQSEKYCYKYNLRTKIWTQLSNCANTMAKAWAVVIGTDIWYGSYLTIYKYNTLNDTHSEVMSAPYALNVSKACTDGSNIYIFGGNFSTTTRTHAYRIDTASSIFTQLTNIPVGMYNHSCLYDGDRFVYLFGGEANPTSAYKYDIDNNSYTKLKNIPFDYYYGLIAQIKNYIYLISSNNSAHYYTMFEYDILKESYTQLTNIPRYRFKGHVGIMDGAIYMIGGGYNSSGESNVSNGDSVLIRRVIEANMIAQRLCKGINVYSDGDVFGGTIIEFKGIKVLDDAIMHDKTNGVVRISNDGEYAIVNGSYATIGG